jgi:hypothetical protein
MAMWRASGDKKQANNNDKRARKQHKEGKERHPERAASATSAVVFETLEPRVLLNASLVATGVPSSEAMAAAAVVSTVQPNLAQAQPDQANPSGKGPIATDAQGTQLFVSLAGPGQFQFTQDASGPKLVVSGTTENSRLTLDTKGGDGHFQFGTIAISGALGSIEGSGIDLQGSLSAGGAIDSVELGNVRNSSVLVQGAIGDLELGDVRDTTLAVVGSIDKLSVNSWVASPNAQNQLSAASIATLSSDGDFGASLSLAGVQSANHGNSGNNALTLGDADIAGTLAHGLWYVVGQTGQISAAQVASDWTGDFTVSLDSLSTTGGHGSSSGATVTLNGDFSGQLPSAPIRTLRPAWRKPVRSSAW